MNLETSIKGLLDAQRKLSNATTMHSPTLISDNFYRLGQYTAEVERFLGEAEEEYEILWAKEYKLAVEKLSATAAKQHADVETAAAKGNIKKLTRYVGSSWKTHTGAMARWNHLNSERQGMNKIA